MRTSSSASAAHAVRRLGFQPRRPRQRVPGRRGLAARLGLLDDHVDDRPVLGVHADEPAVVAGPAQGAEDARIVDVEDARVGGEELEAGHAFPLHQVVHVAQRLLVHLAHDHVEAVIDDRLALGLLMPLRQALLERPALGLDGEVHQAGRAAEGRRHGARLEVIGAGRSAEGHVEVRVHIDTAGDDVLAARIDSLVYLRVDLAQVGADGADLFVLDQEVGLEGIGRGDEGAVLDERAHRVLLLAEEREFLTPFGLREHAASANHGRW
jgi:hypothetical protein